MEKLFAVSAPSLEPFTARELNRLGMADEAASAGEPLSPASDVEGGVEFMGNLETIYRANLFLRTASRVLVRLGEFHAAAFSELYRRACQLDWEHYITPGKPVAVRVTCHKSRLYHSTAVAREVVKAIATSLGHPVDLQKFDDHSEDALPQLVIVRLVNDRCTISVDSTGALLHRRGYHLAAAKAPLRETLAAGLILASGWDGTTPLLDPFCGSGTIPVEAALMVCQIAPGRKRQFAFMDWPGFNLLSWQSLLTEAENQRQFHIPKIYASDRDAGAVQMAQANAQRAGVFDYIDFSCQAVSAVEPAGVGTVVTNPPYGLRLSANKDLRNLYAQFGKVLRTKCPGWQVTILCSDLQLLHQTGLKLDTHLSFINGGVKVKVGRGMVGV